jgi:hypothetical protein
MDVAAPFIKFKGDIMGCKNCEKLKNALISLIQESDVIKLKIMRDYLMSILDEQDNHDAEISMFAINTLIEVLEEEQNGPC